MFYYSTYLVIWLIVLWFFTSKKEQISRLTHEPSSEELVNQTKHIYRKFTLRSCRIQGLSR